MGKKQSKLPPTEMRDLMAGTHFTDKELKEWYQGFSRDCPAGRLSLEQFSKIYGDFYGTSEAARFAEHLFRTFDVNNDGTIDFREFICSLSITTRGNMEEKLRWAFDVYDVDSNGVISKDEITSIVKSINKMTGNVNSKMASEEHVMDLFRQFDKNKDDLLSREEFIEGAKKDRIFVAMLQCVE